MKSSTISFVIAVAIGTALLAANNATAGCGGGGYKFGYSGHHRHVYHKPYHHAPVYRHYQRPYVEYYVQPEVVVAAPVIPQTPPARIAVTAEEKPRTQVPIGSVLLLDGQPLGALIGTVKLEIEGREMPVEVIEWTPTFVKIRLPMLNLTGPVDGDIDVVRADGSVASCSPLEFMPVAAAVPPSIKLSPAVPASPIQLTPTIPRIQG
jgi:hypothetical protein